MQTIAVTINTTLGGARFYAEDLARHLPLADRTNRYAILTDEPSALGDWPGIENQRFRKLGYYTKYQSPIWDHAQVPLAALFERADLVHHTKCACPLLRTTPVVTTIHDVAFFLFPDMYARSQGAYMRANYRYAAGKSAHIITDSENSKKDIVEVLGVEEQRISAIHLAASADMHPVADGKILDKVRQRYGVPDKYILYLGTIHPAKNIQALIRAYQILKSKLGIPHSLVIAGRKGWMTEKIDRQARSVPEAPIIFTGIIEHEDKPALYSGATLFVSPTLYEGFGLTILEALACGVPVISSNVSSVPEVAGDAAILIDPRSESELVKAMERVLSDRLLQETLRSKGPERSRMFSWSRTARETVKVYEQLL